MNESKKNSLESKAAVSQPAKKRMINPDDTLFCFSPKLDS